MPPVNRALCIVGTGCGGSWSALSRPLPVLERQCPSESQLKDTVAWSKDKRQRRLPILSLPRILLSAETSSILKWECHLLVRVIMNIMLNHEGCSARSLTPKGSPIMITLLKRLEIVLPHKANVCNPAKMVLPTFQCITIHPNKKQCHKN